MAFAMLVGSFSVMGSAYSAYRGDAVTYNDVDAATFTTEQYASMGFDEVDRMLAEEQLNLYIYIGSLDLTSVDNAIASVEELLDSVSNLLTMLGDAGNLNISDLAGKRRSAGTINGIDADLALGYAVFDFLATNAGILRNYANGSFSLGIMNSFVAEYVFNVRELVVGLIYGLTDAGKARDYDYMDAREDYGTGAGLPAQYLNETNGAITLAQDLLNEVVLGHWEKLDDYFDNPYDDHIEVIPGFYSFEDANGNDVSDQPIDTDAYDYWGYVHPKNWVTVGLGGAKRVADGAAAPEEDFELCDIRGNVKGYDFIEALLQRAFNYVLIPVLNRDTAPWLKEMCGFDFPAEKCNKQIYNTATQTWENNPNYVENYPGDAPEGIEDNPLYNLFETENLVVSKAEFTEGTLIENFNRILGDFVGQVLKLERGVEDENGWSWDWNYAGGNAVLFDNICNVAKYVLKVTGDQFFASYIEIKTPEEIDLLNPQQTVAYVLRSILNASVDWMYIEDSEETDCVAEVGYAACEQLAWQDIPQITYTKPVRDDFTSDEAYYDALVNKALTILMDEAAFNLNQSLDVNKEDGNDPVNYEGLLPYQGDDGSYENNIVMIGEWAIQTYGPALALNFNLADNGSHDIDDFWGDLDTIIDSILPIVGNDSIINDDIANQPRVFKSLIFDNIVKPVCYLNATNFAAIFDRNEQGIFAKQNGIEIIMTILNKVFDLLFPNVFAKNVTTIDALLDNDLLGTMIFDLAKSLGTKPANSITNEGYALSPRAVGLVYVALPIVCQVLGLSDDQEFGELENYMPGILSGSGTTFTIYNGTSGINTGYTDVNGNEYVDETYTYNIVSAFANGYRANGTSKELSISINKSSIGGGEDATVTLSGYETGMVVEANIEYNVTDESGANMTSSSLTNTVYGYVGSVEKDDDEIEKILPVGSTGKSIKYESEVYVASGDKLTSKLNSYGIRLVDTDEQKNVENPSPTGTVTVTNVSVNSSAYPFVAQNTDSNATSQSIYGQGATYFFTPFQVAQDGNGETYVRIADVYEKDENGKDVVDEDGNKTIVGDNGGVPTGKYTITTTLNVAGTTVNVTTNVHIYDDYSLESLFDRTVAANRQKSNYNTKTAAGDDAWTAYVEALKEAAKVALKPKNGDSFETDIATSETGYRNKYQICAEDLNNAIKELEKYVDKSTGTGAIEAAINTYSPSNTIILTDDNGYNYAQELEYDDPDYEFFSWRDYLYYTYKRYRDVKNEAESIVNSQRALIKAPLPENPTDEQLAAYDAQCKAVDEFEAPVLSAVDVEYNTHMVNLMGSRLIPIAANKSKLAIALDWAADIDPDANYTSGTYADYTRALTFAQTVYDDNSADLKPSKVNTAHNELVEAWKKLAIAADYSALNAAMDEAADAISFGTPDEQTEYTYDSYLAFYDAYQAAANLDKGLEKTESNQDLIDEITANLTEAFAGLVEEGGSGDEPGGDEECNWELNTSFEFYTSASVASSTAYTNDDYLNYLFGIDADHDGKSDVNHLLFGIGEYYSAADYEALFINLENAEVEVIPTEMGEGTGTIINIYNTITGEKVDSYMVVIRGDCTGDSTITSDDETEIIYFYNMMDGYDWLYTEEQKFMYAGGDTDNDWSVDGNDSSNIELFYNMMIDIGQFECEAFENILEA